MKTTSWLARITAPFRKLRWRMTFSYTGVTVGALVVLEVLIITGGLIAVNRFFHSPLLARALEQSYSQTLIGALRPHMRRSPPDLEGLRRALDLYGDEEPLTAADNGILPSVESGEATELFVVDAEGSVLAVSGPRIGDAPGEPYTSLEIEGLRPLVEAALEGAPLARRYAFAGRRILLATSIVDEESGQLLGVVGWTMPVPAVDQRVVRDLLPVAVVVLLVFTLGTGAIGTLFGFLTSHSLVRRLDQLASVSSEWSRGDFSTFVHAEGGDEIAALGRRMNRMAEQLQNLLAERNRLAVVEERNRIARDLHDSAKQQAFAAAGQIGAAKALMNRDIKAAEAHLSEAEELIYSLRQELTLLIEELRPAALEERGLGPALREYAGRWSRRTGIGVEIEAACSTHLSLETEHALFRIAQEALANVARHSRASNARVVLTCPDGRVRLTVSDDGIGFNPQQVATGFGLNSIRQRAASLPNGTCALHSAPSEGTTVEIEADPHRQERKGG